MRSTATYLHNLANLRALDTLNAEIASAESVEPALARSIAHEARRAAEDAFTPSERAWFRRALTAAVFALAMAVQVHGAHADTTGTTGTNKAQATHVDSPAVTVAKRDLTVARERLHDVRASERQIKAHAHEMARAAKLRAQLTKIEAQIATGEGR
jgi:hypothetical protein